MCATHDKGRTSCKPELTGFHFVERDVVLQEDTECVPAHFVERRNSSDKSILSLGGMRRLSTNFKCRRKWKSAAESA